MQPVKSFSLAKIFRAVFVAIFVAIVSLVAPVLSHAEEDQGGTLDVLLFGNYNLTSVDTGNMSSNSSDGSWANNFQSGGGGGLGIGYWLNNVVDFRVVAQANIFPSSAQSTLGLLTTGSFPLTAGAEVKLFGNNKVYLYGVADAGAAYEIGLSTSSSSGSPSFKGATAWSAYADAGIGVNFYFLFAEVKMAYLAQLLPGNLVPGQTGFYYVPVSAGFNF